MTDESTGMTPDQVIEAKHAMAGMAEILREYFLKLREEGFSKTEAFRLVLEYQRNLMGGNRHE